MRRPGEGEDARDAAVVGCGKGGRMARWFVLLVLLLPVYVGAQDLEDRHLDLSLVVGAAMPGVVEASWYDDFDPAYTAATWFPFAPMARISLTWWPDPRRAWVAPTFSVHYTGFFLPEPFNMGYWDGRDHWIPDDGVHFVELEAGVRTRFFLSDAWTVDPALSLGFCHTFSSSIDARNSGMTLNAAADLRWWQARWQPLVSIGFMMQVYGGVQDIVFVRSSPVVYAAVGAGF
jgi:hypothetical protein